MHDYLNPPELKRDKDIIVKSNWSWNNFILSYQVHSFSYFVRKYM
jgi:hypothetical protein